MCCFYMSLVRIAVRVNLENGNIVVLETLDCSCSVETEMCRETGVNRHDSALGKCIQQ